MKITVSVVLFYVYWTAAANLIEVVGWTEAIGIAGQTGVGETLSDAVAELGSINAGNLAVESLISVYLVITTAVETFLVALSAGPRLLVNLGIPIEFVLFIHAPVPLLAGRLLIYAASGREL